MTLLNRFRTFHWLLATVFLLIYLSGDDGSLFHIWLGYFLVVFVTIRIVFALIRMKGFPVLYPSFQYGVTSVTISTLLVMALFLFASITLISGLVMVDHRQIIGFASTKIVTPAYADDDSDMDQEQHQRKISRISRDASSHAIKEVHEVAANLTLGLSVVHILFVLMYRRRFALCMIRGSSENSGT
jgi:3-ketosteroid 9alpha-monooxygenase subunit B